MKNRAVMFFLLVRKTVSMLVIPGILKPLLWIIFNSYKFLTKERSWDMFHTRHGRKGGEGFNGRNVGGFFRHSMVVFGEGAVWVPAFREGFFVNICSEEGR